MFVVHQARLELTGAALTRRPDLFRAVLCGFPERDMVRFYTFTAINNLPDLLWTPRRPRRQPPMAVQGPGERRRGRTACLLQQVGAAGVGSQPQNTDEN